MSRLLELAPGRWAHASGALWLSETRTLLLADVHLGYGWAQRRRGELGPVSDGGAREKLQGVVEELDPGVIVFLGDVVHAPRPGPLERALVEETLGPLAARLQVVAVRGNHDRAFARDFPHLGIQVVNHWDGSGIYAVHGDRPCAVPERGQVLLGHLHPAIGIRDDAGASRRIPAFLSGPHACVLPAFSPFAAGFDVRGRLPPELRALFREGVPEVLAATGRRVVRLGPLNHLRQVG